MKKRILALLLAVMMVCPLLAACSKDHYDYSSYKDMIILGDISKIEVKEADIENGILGMYYDFFSDEISAKTVTSTTLTSGTVKYGDTVNIDYKGYKLSDGKAFDGGSTYDSTGKPKGADLEIGSGSYIEGFESGLIDHEVGETVSLYLTFPETYGTADLAGQKVRFDVVINKITTRYAYPEMTDAKVKEQSGGEFETVEAFRASAREDTLKNLIWADYYELCKVKKWPEKELKDYYYNSLEQYKNYASMMGTTLDTYATYMGYTDGTALRQSIMSQARQQCKQDLMVLALTEAENLTMSEKDLEKAMKGIYKESVAEGYEGSYKDYLKDNEESAVRIAAYTDVAMDFIKAKVTPIKNLGKNGFYGATDVYYYINGVKQTGWHKIDLDGDGNFDTHFFNPDRDGRAYLNVAVKMKAEGSDKEQFLKFGDKGIYKGIANNEVIFANITGKESDKGGYIYVVDDKPATGVQLIDRTGEIADKEQYLFAADGYMALGAVKLTADKFPGIDFGAFANKYYNFGTSGILNINLETKENGLYGENSANGLANGLIDEKAYKDGDMIVSDTYKDSDNNVYYFDENGNMAKSKLVSIDNKLYYFDNTGKMLTGTADKPLTQEIDGITYTIGESGEITSAKRIVDNAEQKNTPYVNSDGTVYYFDAVGQMVRNDFVSGVTVNDATAKRYFDAYGKMVKDTTITVGSTVYTIDANGAVTNEAPAGN